MQGIIRTFKINSQNYNVLNYLKLGKKLTCLDALKLGLTHNLRSRIADLKRAGYDVITEYEKVNSTVVSVYSLGGAK